jgi:protein phosphatase
MGSRAVILLCRDVEAARRRFGVTDGTPGACVTRTGRRFFEEEETETALLARVGAAMEAAGLWTLLETDWVCLDCELMPWSAKAQALLRGQYAPVGAAARASLAAAVAALEQAGAMAELREQYRARQERASRYVAAYRRYCWPVRGLEDLKVAPFHLLATESGVHTNRDHLWHMETLAALCRADAESGRAPVLLATSYRTVDLSDPESEATGTRWWEELTGSGGEGMVVKPLDFIARGTRGLVQPAVKCRGREYLRIIYGPEYDAPENLERLRSRSLAHKRALALREFALGVEALERFHRGEPLRRVHECVFGILALESEPVDPRL